MRLSTTVYFLLAVQLLLSQTKPAPFSEANRAIASLEEERRAFDSLRKVYENRFSLSVTYGQRFLLNSDISSLPDTITNVDFTERRGFYGLGASYFINDSWSVGVEFNVTILPRKEEVRSISFGSNGISGEGSGNGGIAANIGIGSRYYFKEDEYFRPYAGVYIGMTNLIASGGEVRFSSSSGQNQTVETLRTRLRTGQLLAGFGYRTSPGFIIDFNVGFSRTSRTNLIGGVTSYGGITTSLTTQFVLNHKNK